MEKILGLDLGTNSIGWAVIERGDNNVCKLLDRGVNIFQDGVAHDKSGEKPAVQERTAARSSRRHYFRRRLRKIELLKVLIDNKLCPALPVDALLEWKRKKLFPLQEDFINWQRTDENKDKNPYHDRYLSLFTTLDLNKQEDRYVLGRALYHLNQRRGFLSNRKEAADGSDGKVAESISSLSKEISAAGCKYVGEYFYKMYSEGKKIRNRYTAREEHYKKEFYAVCERQNLPESLIHQLERAIFYQRQLKSQKGNVGHCKFEPDKPCCPVSHPRFEEFRMLQFINSIRLQSPADDVFRPINNDELAKIMHLFYRKSKPDFEFEELAKAIAGKGNYCSKDDSGMFAYRFNYSMSTDVPGCPVSAAIISAINSSPALDWEEDLCSIYTKGNGKTQEQIVNDVWHALFSFGNDEKLTEWLSGALQIDEKAAGTLSKFNIPQGYASLSLKAINKIIPWLKRGLVYSDAVFFANLAEVLPKNVIENKDRLSDVEENIRILLDGQTVDGKDSLTSKYKNIYDYLLGVDANVNANRLYHPSQIDLYKPALPDENGQIRLGSPRTNAFKNPMAMRALFRLRKLINALLSEGVIDPKTKINIEFARGLNDTNKRKAIQDYQKNQEALRSQDRQAIIALFKSEGIEYEPSAMDLLKYRLYEEQNHRCIYTDKQITPRMFLGSATEFDIEHTIPRSRGGDDSQMNKTLCDSRFNRDVKKSCIPSELENHAILLDRVSEWKNKVEELDKQIAFCRRKSKHASSKEEKDNAIRRAHFLTMERDYWRGKYDRFVMDKVPEGFSNRQGVDIGIIGRYARMYLKTVFNKIYVVKGATTADFRKAWGLQSDYEKKERVNHSHHCIDAVTIACIGKNEYDAWAKFMKQDEEYRYGRGKRPIFEKPWPTFTEDVLAITSELTVPHYTPDNMSKYAKKKLRVRGVIQRNDAGEIKYARGDSARGSLHLDTFYGSIKVNDEVKYVVRKSLDSLKDSDIDKIVDETVRDKVKAAVEKHGSLKKAVAEGVWMNETLRIPINKVRIFVPSVTNPISLKKQRFKSTKDYKQNYYVANDSNYCMAVYGMKKPSFKLLNALEAAKMINGKREILIPQSDDKDNPLRFVLKMGTMVLFYDNSPAELLECDMSELSRRLYKVTGMSVNIVQSNRYGMVELTHHLEARPYSELKRKNGKWQIGEDIRPKVVLTHHQLNIWVEGVDFDISETGKITFKPHPVW